VDVTNIDKAIHRVSENIRDGTAQLYQAPILQISADSVEVFKFDLELGHLIAT